MLKLSDGEIKILVDDPIMMRNAPMNAKSGSRMCFQHLILMAGRSKRWGNAITTRMRITC